MTERPLLAPKHRKAIEALLQEHLPDVEVWAYGSRVNGRAHEGSDLDLVLRAPGLKEVPDDRFADFREALYDSNIPFLVEARDWARLPERFHGEIERDYVVLRAGSDKSVGGKWRETEYGIFSSEFEEHRLADLCETDGGIQTGPFGSQLHKKDYVPVGTPIVTVEHLGDNRIIHRNLPRVSAHDRDRLSKYSLRQGDIVFSRVGSVDRRAIVGAKEADWLFSGRCLRVRPEASKIDPVYLSYFFGLPSFKEHIRSIAVGATMPSLNTQILSDIVVICPPLTEQQAIANILSTLDDKIELNRRMNETLEAMARAIFKDWFVDFGPVQAKMEGRDTGLPDRIAALFPDRMVESELGEVPEGWAVKPLKDCFNFTMGQSPPGSSYNEEEGLPFFQGRTDFGFRYPENRKYCTAPTRIAERDDTLVSVRAPVGDINMAWEKCCIGRGVAAFRHYSGSRSFTYYSARAMQHELKEYEHTGTVFGAINKKQFEAISVVNPALEIVSLFENKIGFLDERIRENISERRSLVQARDILLPKLVSGEIRIQEMDQRVTLLA